MHNYLEQWTEGITRQNLPNWTADLSEEEAEDLADFLIEKGY